MQAMEGSGSSTVRCRASAGGQNGSASQRDGDQTPCQVWLQMPEQNTRERTKEVVALGERRPGRSWGVERTVKVALRIRGACSLSRARRRLLAGFPLLAELPSRTRGSRLSWVKANEWQGDLGLVSQVRQTGRQTDRQTDRQTAGWPEAGREAGREAAPLTGARPSANSVWLWREERENEAYLGAVLAWMSRRSVLKGVLSTMSRMGRAGVRGN
jgi:hypothetical protein